MQQDCNLNCLLAGKALWGKGKDDVEKHGLQTLYGYDIVASPTDEFDISFVLW